MRAPVGIRRCRAAQLPPFPSPAGAALGAAPHVAAGAHLRAHRPQPRLPKLCRAAHRQGAIIHKRQRVGRAAGDGVHAGGLQGLHPGGRKRLAAPPDAQLGGVVAAKHIQLAVGCTGVAAVGVARLGAQRTGAVRALPAGCAGSCAVFAAGERYAMASPRAAARAAATAGAWRRVVVLGTHLSRRRCAECRRPG